MKFKEALKRAGLHNPGRTTWCGVATDGAPVFTIWAHDIRQIDGRFFAWWDHNNTKPGTGEGMPKNERGHARAFVRLAAKNLGTPCRAVIVHRKPHTGEVASADYPHPRWARAEFRCADYDALQFIVELRGCPDSC